MAIFDPAPLCRVRDRRSGRWAVWNHAEFFLADDPGAVTLGCYVVCVPARAAGLLGRLRGLAAFAGADLCVERWDALHPDWCETVPRLAVAAQHHLRV